MARKRATGPGALPRAFPGRGLPLAVREIPGSLYGIGIDLLRTERMEKIHARHGERLLKRLLLDEEVAEVRRRTRPARRIAMSFAAKEAFVKALGTGFRGVGYRDAGVVHEKSGKPVLIYSAAMRARLKRLGIGNGQVSLTDEGGMIAACVVLEKITPTPARPPRRRP